jgi:hypothetical protein
MNVSAVHGIRTLDDRQVTLPEREHVDHGRVSFTVIVYLVI